MASRRKRGLKAANGTIRPSVATSSFSMTLEALSSGRDVVLSRTVAVDPSSGTPVREEVRVRPSELEGSGTVGRFGFLEYHGRTRVFVDDLDTGIERRYLPAAMVGAAAFVGGHHRVDEAARPHFAEAACRVLGIPNQ
jgi:hypothetical protein